MSSPERAAALARVVIGQWRAKDAPVSRMTVWGVEGIGEIRPGDPLAELIATACAGPPNGPLADGDVLVVTQKIVSKAEGRLVAVDPDDPLSHKAVVEEEAVRILRRRGDLVITETRHGFVCANSGVDLSNVRAGRGRPPADRLRPLGPPHPRRPPGPPRRRGGRHRVRHVRAARGGGA